jgi:hypothetical protein
MQFLARVMPGGPGMSASQGVLSIFMCGNDPGMCDEWDAAAGGNQALVFVGGSLVPAAVPAGPAVMLGEVSAVQYVTVSADYDDARQAWAAREGRPMGDVLGQVGGQPSWLQADETPACPECGKPMSFVVQLEEGHDYRTAANCGGGAADTGSPASHAARQPFSGSGYRRTIPRAWLPTRASPNARCGEYVVNWTEAGMTNSRYRR